MKTMTIKALNNYVARRISTLIFDSLVFVIIYSTFIIFLRTNFKKFIQIRHKNPDLIKRVYEKSLKSRNLKSYVHLKTDTPKHKTYSNNTGSI